MMKTEDYIKLYRHNLNAFIQCGFNILNPHESYLHNWHVDIIADTLAKVESGEIKRLIINLQPRMLKSHCASICLPAWILGRNPRKKILCVSGSQDLSMDLESQFRTLVNSGRYKHIFPNVPFSESGRKIITPYGGFRKSVCIDSQVTGGGADIIIVDDPISAHKAQEEPARSYVNQQFDLNYLQRLNSKKDGAIIVVMQRLHEDDLSGHILKNNDGWAEINLSAFAVEDEEWVIGKSGTVTRKKWEPLHPERESFEQLQNIRYMIGAEAFASQYLQLQLKPTCAAVILSKKYETLEAWKEQDPSGYFAEFFLRDHPAVVLPETKPFDEFECWVEVD